MVESILNIPLLFSVENNQKRKKKKKRLKHAASSSSKANNASSRAEGGSVGWRQARYRPVLQGGGETFRTYGRLCVGKAKSCHLPSLRLFRQFFFLLLRPSENTRAGTICRLLGHTAWGCPVGAVLEALPKCHCSSPCCGCEAMAS